MKPEYNPDDIRDLISELLTSPVVIYRECWDIHQVFILSIGDVTYRVLHEIGTDLLKSEFYIQNDNGYLVKYPIKDIDLLYADASRCILIRELNVLGYTIKNK